MRTSCNGFLTHKRLENVLIVLLLFGFAPVSVRSPRRRWGSGKATRGVGMSNHDDQHDDSTDYDDDFDEQWTRIALNPVFEPQPPMKFLQHVSVRAFTASASRFQAVVRNAEACKVALHAERLTELLIAQDALKLHIDHETSELKASRKRKTWDALTIFTDGKCTICESTEGHGVFACGHGACVKCFKQIRVCHICRAPARVALAYDVAVAAKEKEKATPSEAAAVPAVPHCD